MSDISKLCADFLRAYVLSIIGTKLKATHARELVAAFFGYKSHAALLADRTYPVNHLADAALLVPDAALIDARRLHLAGLPPAVPAGSVLAEATADFLRKQGHFTGQLCPHDPLETYVLETVLPEADEHVLDELAGEMATTNATGFETYYESADAQYHDSGVTVEVMGSCHGDQDPDKMFSGDTISMAVTVDLPLVAGRNGYGEADISAVGAVNHDYVDIA